MRDASRLTRPQADRLSLLRRRIKDLREWARKDFYWWLIVIPILQSILITHLSAIGFHEWQNHTVFKNLMAWVHPCILLAFALIVLQRWRLERTYTWVAFHTGLHAVLPGAALRRIEHHQLHDPRHHGADSFPAPR